MKIFEANISFKVADYLHNSLQNIGEIETANQEIYKAFGFIDFFECDEDLEILKKFVSNPINIVSDQDRAEYGDFQTNNNLADKITAQLKSQNVSPQIVIEPTCGKGNFIIASLKKFESIEKIYAVEIYKPYVWECKFNIIDFYLENRKRIKPSISIVHKSIFDFDFKNIAKQNSEKEILVIGNPPWVTNSKLGSLNSENLPQKNNFKKHSGIDAITGKGNFDIAEFISIMLIETFQNHSGNMAFLVKNSVIKNLVYDQKQNKYAISELEKYTIDSKKEFNVSVEASLFCCKFNSHPQLVCQEYDLYNNDKQILSFGWKNEKFVSNIELYSDNFKIDGTSPFIWRQGLKHDCSSIMELERVNGHFVNGLDEKITLESDLVYGLLKSSDLKSKVVTNSRKYTIVTQKKVGQETNYIKYDFPQTFEYLSSHTNLFNARKSSIYKNKPPFSIFGVGDYSFKPFKIAISGLYKTFHFSLVLPNNGKPLMLDDTCYLIGFDNIDFAVFCTILLNSQENKEFLQSITFPDSKRTFTKDVLMRIDLYELSELIPNVELEEELKNINKEYQLNVSLERWKDFQNEMSPMQNGQMQLFT